MSLNGVGLNLMSLGGIALGIGMLVDTAIVVMEAADRAGGTNADPQQRHRGIAIGVGEISGAVIAACLTSIAVFVPLAFLPGLLGRLFYDQAFTVSASHVVSLIIGLALVPTLLALPHMSLPVRYGSWRWPLVSGGGFSARWWNPLFIPIRVPWLIITAMRWFVIQCIRLLLLLAIGLLWLVRGPTRLLLAPFDHLCRTGLQLSEQFYARILRRVVSQPLVGLSLFAGALAIGLTFIPQLPVRLMPPSLSSRFTVDIELPRNHDIHESHQWTLSFLRQLRAWRPDCDAMAISGEDSVYTAGLNKRSEHEVRVIVTVGKRASHLPEEIAFLAELEQRALAAGALSAAALTPPLVDLGMGSTLALDLAIYGSDQETLQQLGLAYSAQLRALGCRGVATSATAIAEEILIVPDAARLFAAGLTTAQLSSAIAGAAERKEISGFIPRAGPNADSGRSLPIRLQGALASASISDLRSLNLGTAVSPIPLGSVASIERRAIGGLILRRDGSRVTSITGISLPTGMDTRAVMDAITAQHPLPAGYRLSNVGIDSITSQGLTAMTGMLLLSIFLVVVVMAIQFESVSQPLIVILSIPMAAAGAFPALFVLGHGLDVMSGIGLVVLVGVAVANAIVLVTTANLRRDQGMSPAEAIATAGRERFRPILMTTATSVFGLLPLAIGWGEAAELRAPLAVAVMGGLCSSTILTLVSLPSVLLLLTRKK
jgi:HAE1 family hydrophobic/amphiphilic exporter-1